MTAGARLPRPRRATVAWAAALACWVAFIWGHSLVPGAQSTAESDAVAGLLAALLPPLGSLDPDLVTLVVRKGAHLAEYAVLGVLLAGLVRSRRGGRALPVVAPVALVPLVDEAIQLGVPGRTGQLPDVLVDLVGMLLGASALLLVARARRGRG